MPEEKRITLLVDAEMHDRITELIPRGFRKHLISALIELVMDAIERDGEIVIGAIMAREFKLVRADS